MSWWIPGKKKNGRRSIYMVSGVVFSIYVITALIMVAFYASSSQIAWITWLFDVLRQFVQNNFK